jgi:hypothetical protein
MLFVPDSDEAVDLILETMTMPDAIQSVGPFHRSSTVTVLAMVIENDRRAAKKGTIPSRRTRSGWAKRIRNAWQNAAEAIIETGRLLIAAKASLRHGQFQKMIKGDLPFGPPTANKLMKIARDARIAAHGQHLSPCWATLYEISKLPDGEFKEALKRGIIRPDAQRKDIEKFRSEVKTRERDRKLADLAKTLPPVTDRFELHNSSCAQLLKGPPAMADVVFADPQYGKAGLKLHDLLGRTAAHVLKPGGSLLCMLGHIELPALLNTLRKHLTYRWQLICLYENGRQPRCNDRRVMIGYKPILWFTRGTYSGPFISDIIPCKFSETAKSLHEWGQSEHGMRNLLKQFVKPGDTVVDLCMGSATTGIAALELGARFIGYDPDEAAFNAALARLNGCVPKSLKAA